MGSEEAGTEHTPDETGAQLRRYCRIKSFHCSRKCLMAVVAMVAAWMPLPVPAQTIEFGSADDPREVLQHVWWRRDDALQILGGASLIGPQWRAAAHVGYSFVGRSFTGRLGGTFR